MWKIRTFSDRSVVSTEKVFSLKKIQMKYMEFLHFFGGGGLDCFISVLNFQCSCGIDLSCHIRNNNFHVLFVLFLHPLLISKLLFPHMELFAFNL